MRINNKAQATTELAIFGSLILVCFAVIVSYGQSLQEQQILQQQVFRKALKKAFDENAFVSYNIIKNARTANVFGRYGEGGRGSVSAGASVNWILGEPAEKSYYQVNEDTLEIPGDSKIVDVETEAGTTYVAQETRSEDNLGISSRKKAKLVETLTTRLKINEVKGRMMRKKEIRGSFPITVPSQPGPGGFGPVGGSITVGGGRVVVDIPVSETRIDDIVITQGLDTDGRYRASAAGTEVSKEREWVTPHTE